MRSVYIGYINNQRRSSFTVYETIESALLSCLDAIQYKNLRSNVNRVEEIERTNKDWRISKSYMVNVILENDSLELYIIDIYAVTVL